MITQSKFNAAHSSLNSVAKKVYEVVPIAEPWTAQQIHGEIRRLGISLDFRVVHGSLDNMQANGLVKEGPSGSYIREAVRPVAVKSETTMEVAMTKATVTLPPAKRNPLDILADLATRAAGMASDLESLSEAIADAVIDIQAQEEAGNTELTQLRQLKSLLKGLT